MSINEYLRGLALAVFAAVATTGAASAAVLNEASLPGGAFSGDWRAPTEIGAGYDAVSGTGYQNVKDIFVFTGLKSGAQQLTFDFTAPAGINESYSAGGSVNYAFAPFMHEWDGQAAGWVQVDFYKTAQQVVLSLGESFSGALYVALNFTHGANLGYNIAAPGNAVDVAPAPIPLPAGALLIGSALGAIGLVRARSRRRGRR